MLTNEEARQRVANGAAHLDSARPGWEHRIDVGTLTLHDPCGCIVGQLCGGFDMRSIGLRTGLQCRQANELADSATYGFDLDASEMIKFVGTREQKYQPLQDAWIEAIADRRLRSAQPGTVDAVDPHGESEGTLTTRV